MEHPADWQRARDEQIEAAKERKRAYLRRDAFKSKVKAGHLMLLVYAGCIHAETYFQTHLTTGNTRLHVFVEMPALTIVYLMNLMCVV